jgi:hypothetical protein
MDCHIYTTTESERSVPSQTAKSTAKRMIRKNDEVAFAFRNNNKILSAIIFNGREQMKEEKGKGGSSCIVRGPCLLKRANVEAPPQQKNKNKHVGFNFQMDHLGQATYSLDLNQNEFIG